MYKIIEQIKPYFFSLREIGGNLSLDLKIPSTWNFQQNVEKMHETVNIKVQDKLESTALISIISTSDKDGFTFIFDVAKEIIKFNLEEEEKRKLFDDMVKQLQNMFMNKSLDDLKNINFEKNEKNGNRSGSRTDGKGKEEV